MNSSPKALFGTPKCRERLRALTGRADEVRLVNSDAPSASDLGRAGAVDSIEEAAFNRETGEPLRENQISSQTQEILRIVGIDGGRVTRVSDRTPP